MKRIPRGWSRRAIQEIPRSVNRGMATIQGTLWRDKKVVGYLHTHKVEPTTESTKVRRYSKSDREHSEINAPPVSSDYSKYMNGVDRMDRDNADWSVSIRTDRWYLRIFFWLLDCVVFGTYLVATNLGDEEWNKNYKEKYNGRRRFQVDLAMALFEEGLTRDWNGDLKDDNGRPKWCRQRGFIPCNCGVCFFCKHGHTAGVGHGIKTARPEVMQCVGNERKTFKAHPQTCAVCYKKERVGKKRKAREVEKNASRTRMGCPVCNTVVCKSCWKEFVEVKHDLNKLVVN